MSKALPGFSALQANYPATEAGSDVIASIGGEAAQPWVGNNTCVMRMSKAFNYAGPAFKIPGSSKGFLTVKGADGMNYGIRVIEFIDFLHNTYKVPDIVKKGADMTPAAFKDKTGIIAWLIDGWSDARGHFTLWDGATGLYQGGHDYFADFGPGADPKGPHMTAVKFWTC